MAKAKNSIATRAKPRGHSKIKACDTKVRKLTYRGRVVFYAPPAELHIGSAASAAGNVVQAAGILGELSGGQPATIEWERAYYMVKQIRRHALEVISCLDNAKTMLHLVKTGQWPIHEYDAKGVRK